MKCKSCKNPINKGKLRLGVAVHSSTFDGSFLTYFHTSCYFKKKTKKQITTSDLDGFKSIRWSDQNKLCKLFGEPVGEEVKAQSLPELARKWKQNALSPGEENELDWKIRELFDNQCSIAETKEQLLINGQTASGGDEDILKRTAQAIVYGIPQRCPSCKEGYLRFDDVQEAWSCKNYADAWSQCSYKKEGFKSIDRSPFKINFTKNKNLIELASFLSMAKPQSNSLILKGLQVAISGRIGRTKAELISFLEHHSGIFNATSSEQTSVFICSENTFHKGNAQLTKAQALGIPIIEEKYLDDCICHATLLDPTNYLLGREKEERHAEVLDIKENIPVTLEMGGRGDNLPVVVTKERKRKSVTVKVMPTTVKALLHADPAASIGVALAQSYFTPEGLPNHALIDVSRFNISYLPEAEEILSTRNLARGLIAFDPICTDEGLDSEIEEIEEQSAFASAPIAKEERPKKPRKKVAGQTFTEISKRMMDPESGINEKKNHIYEEKDGELLYHVILNQTDIQTNSNSFYAMQLVVPDSGKGSIKVWYKWGRIGTKIGSSKLAKFTSLTRAIKDFADKFYNKTRNRWSDYCANRFAKYGGAYFPIEIHYEDEEESVEEERVEMKASKLSPGVQNLMKLIFDTSTMQKAMENMKLDTQKMPLGKLSKRTIQHGFSTLTELENVIHCSLPDREQKLLSLTNKFYTVIPHYFGKKSHPPILDTIELLQEKLEMLQTLADIEIASGLMKEKKLSNENPLDAHYRSLHNSISVLDENHPNYILIEKYLKVAHSHRHSNMRLKVKQIYKVKRKGEEERFRKHDCLRNHTLLWHGSRLSNWAGILSQGLRIAPPEAPHSGYKFGKGIYHANMASMSAEYCHSGDFDNQMCLLISEVALGEQYIQETPKYLGKEDISAFGKHSVLALGQYSLADTPTDTFEVGSSAVIPLGEETHSGFHQCPQDHPEFVVYDTSQVQMKYLLHIEMEKI